jgi:hypothetical protein
MAIIHDTMGTVLKRGAGGAGVTVPGVFEIGPVGLGRALRDVTTLSDTVHKHKLNIPDVPEINVKCYYDPQDTTQAQINYDGYWGVLSTWQILLEQGNSPGESETFTAYVVNPQVESIGIDSDLVLSFTLKPQSVIGEMFQ